MILLIYHNGLCDPENKHGLRKEFTSANELDAFVNAFVASMDHKFLDNWKIFIANSRDDEVTIDHYVLFNENLPGSSKTFTEINVKEKAREVNVKLRELEKQQDARMKRAKEEIDKLLKK